MAGDDETKGAGRTYTPLVQAPACFPPPTEELMCSAMEELPPASIPIDATVSICNKPADEDAFERHDISFEHLIIDFQEMPFASRLECISRRFLGIPFLLDPLGEDKGTQLEGTQMEDTQVDDDPLFRFDALDCMTYVEEAMALAHADSGEDFDAILDGIRYYNGPIGYARRKHFVSADWLPDNTAKGYIRDITAEVGGRFTQQVSVVINRAGWIEGKADFSMTQRFEIIEDLIAQGLHTPKRITMDHIPISAFFIFDGEVAQPRMEVLERLPEISIFLMIRTEELAQKVGVIVAHMGFLLVPREADGSLGTPMIRHGSPAEGLHEEPFLEYILSQRPYRVGVAILEIRE